MISAPGSTDLEVVFITPSAIDRLKSEARKRWAKETGGPLFGYRRDAAMVLTRALGPGPNAVHRATSFEPDPTYVQAAIDRVAEASRGVERHVGSWHTHPRGRPRPSAQDVHMAGILDSDQQAAIDDVIMLIQATIPAPTALRLRALAGFAYFTTDRELRQLPLRVAPELPAYDCSF